MADHHRDDRVRRALDHEADLARLEDVLLALPLDRAVPDLHELLRAAGVGEEVLRDDRALKLLHEALVARPFGSFSGVQQVRTEVELLTLEVELLMERIVEPGTDRAERARHGTRLAEIRTRLHELRDQL